MAMPCCGSAAARRPQAARAAHASGGDGRDSSAPAHASAQGARSAPRLASLAVSGRGQGGHIRSLESRVWPVYHSSLGARAPASAYHPHHQALSGRRIRLIRPIPRHGPAFFGTETGAGASARAESPERRKRGTVHDLSDRVRRPADACRIAGRLRGGSHARVARRPSRRAAAASSTGRSRRRSAAAPAQPAQAGGQPAPQAQPAPAAAGAAGQAASSRS